MFCGYLRCICTYLLPLGMEATPGHHPIFPTPPQSPYLTSNRSNTFLPSHLFPGSPTSVSWCFFYILLVIILTHCLARIWGLKRIFVHGLPPHLYVLRKLSSSKTQLFSNLLSSTRKLYEDQSSLSRSTPRPSTASFLSRPSSFPPSLFQDQPTTPSFVEK